MKPDREANYGSIRLVAVVLAAKAVETVFQKMNFLFNLVAVVLAAKAVETFSEDGQNKGKEGSQ